MYFSEITEDEDHQNPILLIGHSMGGLIIKQLVIYSAKGIHSKYDHHKEYYNIYQRIKGIVFYGTPHRGSHLANIYKLITRNKILEPILKYMGYHSNPAIEDITILNSLLSQLQSEFNVLAGTLSMYEHHNVKLNCYITIIFFCCINKMINR